MENLSLIAAIGRNNEMGIDNNIIWKIPEDLSFYRQFTSHQNIIMGRKTFESMPTSALRNRNIFVLSSKRIDCYCDANSFTDVQELLRYIKNNSNQDFIVVGGSQIYELLLSHVDTMYLTEIEDDTAADTFFPYIDMEEWNIETIYNHYADYRNNDKISYMRNKYTRKRVR